MSDRSPRQPPTVLRRAMRAAIVGVAVLLASVAVAEVAARALVAIYWSEEQVEGMTRMLPVRGRYASHEALPYVLAPGLTPGDRNTNSQGWRGPEFSPTKAKGTIRVACIGASTTYGWGVLWEHTWTARLQRMLAQSGGDFEVLNAGVPGFVSTEVLQFFQHEVMEVDPDIVVFYGGRNDVFPQGYNNYSSDYSHYRRDDYSLESANSSHKNLFRISHLLMVVCTWGGDRFGWSSVNHNPVHGSLRRDTRPSPAEFGHNLEQPGRSETYSSNLQSLAALCADGGIILVLVQIPIRPDLLATGALDHDDRFKEPFGRQITRNNAIVRELASRHNLPIIDATPLPVDASLFVDDCHMTAAGHFRFAQLASDTILAALSR